MYNTRILLTFNMLIRHWECMYLTDDFMMKKFNFYILLNIIFSGITLAEINNNFSSSKVHKPITNCTSFLYTQKISIENNDLNIIYLYVMIFGVMLSDEFTLSLFSYSFNVSPLKMPLNSNTGKLIIESRIRNMTSNYNLFSNDLWE